MPPYIVHPKILWRRDLDFMLVMNKVKPNCIYICINDIWIELWFYIPGRTLTLIDKYTRDDLIDKGASRKKKILYWHIGGIGSFAALLLLFSWFFN